MGGQLDRDEADRAVHRPFDFVALRYVTGAVVLFVLALATRRPLAMPPWG